MVIAAAMTRIGKKKKNRPQFVVILEQDLEVCVCVCVHVHVCKRKREAEAEK